MQQQYSEKKKKYRSSCGSNLSYKLLLIVLDARRIDPIQSCFFYTIWLNFRNWSIHFPFLNWFSILTYFLFFLTLGEFRWTSLTSRFISSQWTWNTMCIVMVFHNEYLLLSFFKVYKMAIKHKMQKKKIKQ